MSTRVVVVSLALAVFGCHSPSEQVRRCRSSCHAKGMEMAGISTLQDTNPLRAGWGETSACQCIPRTVASGAVVTSGCAKDTDCRGDRICRAAQCVDPGETPSPAALVPSTGAVEPAPDTADYLVTVEGKSPEASAIERLSSWEGGRVVATLLSGEAVTGTVYELEEHQLVLRLTTANPGLRTTRSIPYLELRSVERQ